MLAETALQAIEPIPPVPLTHCAIDHQPSRADVAEGLHVSWPTG